ncbi:MAG: hypothetical protein FWH52_06675 [Synergistaceae bacterium]|nr:hypothetical protein [Synergistaceae bacterium]
MKSNYFYKSTNGYAHSAEAITGAEELLAQIKNGSIEADLLRNSFKEFSGELEQDDFLSFCRFIRSHNGKLVFSALEDSK